MVDKEIIISRDKLFSLVRGMKEYRQKLKKIASNESWAVIRKHDIKVEYNLLDKLFKPDAIDKMFNRLDYLNEKLKLIELAQAEEKDEKRVGVVGRESD